MKKKYSKAAAATFILNKEEPIHSWYSYLEGYSSCLINDLILEIGVENIKKVYDPFGGTGTTPLVASFYGIKSYYCETNPFMQQVIEAKINSVKRLKEGNINARYLKDFLYNIKNYKFNFEFENINWNGFEKYFSLEVLFKLKELKKEILKISEKDSQNIALLALASVTVKASKMIRKGDLRFAKDKEKKEGDEDIVSNFVLKLETIIDDIENNDIVKEETIRLADDSREINIENEIDCVITSPPYLNGTNYIRNTKLELKLTDHIFDEKDLPKFHSKGIIAGINNVSSRKTQVEVLDIVKPYIEKLQPVTYDKRIPIMVAGYFYDMKNVIKKLAKAMKNNGYFIMDIGDSQFAGVHIPTHEILIEICKEFGFELYEEDILRERRSKNGMTLSQRLLKFRLNKESCLEDEFLLEAKRFMKEMPYKKEPYSGRNWGHAWHSLCSYHGKLKPAIAYFLIKQFTKPGDIVVDPLSGVGTIPLEACLQKRIGIGNDLSELAFCVTKAKVEKIEEEKCLEVLNELENYIEEHKNRSSIEIQIEKYKNFGFNRKLSEYFHKDTFKELLCARNYFINRINILSPEEAMVYSCLLHILHGNRPYALSRNSHPLTPYAPTGDYIYKNIIEHIKKKLLMSYKKGDFSNYTLGRAIYGDYNNLNNYHLNADIIICSPPFADSIKFYMQNWMRLWLCGWEEEDYKMAENKFLDRKQEKDFGIYDSFFKICSNILKDKGKVILHLGKTNKIDMAEELAKRANKYFIEIYRGTEDVVEIEKHGIKDKGSTKEHQFLFLLKR